MSHGVEHYRREGDVPGPKKGGSLTSPSLFPVRPRVLLEDGGKSNFINKMSEMTLVHSKPEKWNTPPNVRVTFWDFTT